MGEYLPHCPKMSTNFQGPVNYPSKCPVTMKSHLFSSGRPWRTHCVDSKHFQVYKEEVKYRRTFLLMCPKKPWSKKALTYPQIDGTTDKKKMGRARFLSSPVNL